MRSKLRSRRPELAWALFATANVEGEDPDHGSVSVLLGDGTGTTFTLASSPATGSDPRSGAVGDFILPITSPGQFVGNVQVSSTLQLWGAEANVVLKTPYSALLSVTPKLTTWELPYTSFPDLSAVISTSWV